MKSQRLVWSSIVAVGIAMTLSAQSPGPTFEVASVRRSPEALFMSVNTGARLGDRWLAEFATIPAMLRSIHRPNYQWPGQIVGGPSWVEIDRFHIAARIQGNPSAEHIRLMALNLLGDRFGLRTHVETRELPTHRLELARRDGRLGPQLRRIDVDCDAHRAAQGRGEISQSQPPQIGAMPVCVTTGRTAPVSIVESGGVSMSEFASRLSAHAKRPVVDRTGLVGYFALKLEFAWDQPLSSSADSDIPAPPLSVAIQSQLGLRFREARERYEVLVIDAVQQPTEN